MLGKDHASAKNELLEKLRVGYCTRVRVDVPNPVTYLKQTPLFEWYVVRCGPKTDAKKTCVLKKLNYMLKI